MSARKLKWCAKPRPSDGFGMAHRACPHRSRRNERVVITKRLKPGIVLAACLHGLAADRQEPRPTAEALSIGVIQSGRDQLAPGPGAGVPPPEKNRIHSTISTTTTTITPMIRELLLPSDGLLTTTGPLTRPPQSCGIGRRDGRGPRVNGG